MTEVNTSTNNTPPSLPFPISRVEVFKADGPVPGTETAMSYDPWAPLQTRPSTVPATVPPAQTSGDPIAAAQFATVARSRARRDRARAYADRLGAHALEIRSKLAAAAERQVAAAIGTSDTDPVDAGPLRGEAVEVERQHRLALDILVNVEAEHARHEGDLAALFVGDGAARARLGGAHQARAQAQAALDDAEAVLVRAKVHVEAVADKLADARRFEKDSDAAASNAIQAALRDGDAPPITVTPTLRTSVSLEEDLRVARLAADRLHIEHEARVTAHGTAHLAVSAAVDGVLLVEADEMARELAALDERSTQLRQHLVAYAQRAPGDHVAKPHTPGPAKLHPGGWLIRETVPAAVVPKIGQTPAIAAALPMSQFGQSSSIHPAAAAAWQSYADALASDPAAEPQFQDDLLDAGDLRAPGSAIPVLATLHRQIRDATAA